MHRQNQARTVSTFVQENRANTCTRRKNLQHLNHKEHNRTGFVLKGRVIAPSLPDVSIGNP